jgi:hypothetical protein
MKQIMESWRSYVLAEGLRLGKRDRKQIAADVATGKAAKQVVDLSDWAGSNNIPTKIKLDLAAGIAAPCTSSADCTTRCQEVHNSREYVWSARQNKCIAGNEQKKDQHLANWEDLEREVQYMQSQLANVGRRRRPIGDPNQVRYNEYRYLRQMMKPTIAMISDAWEEDSSEYYNKLLKSMRMILEQLQESEAAGKTLTDGTPDGFKEFAKTAAPW